MTINSMINQLSKIYKENTGRSVEEDGVIEGKRFRIPKEFEKHHEENQNMNSLKNKNSTLTVSQEEMDYAHRELGQSVRDVIYSMQAVKQKEQTKDLEKEEKDDEKIIKKESLNSVNKI